MNVTIITSLLSAAASLIVCLINNHYTRIETEKKHDATIMLVTYRLEQLEHKVELHNNLVERMYKVEEQTGIQEEKIRHLEEKGA